ncbi:MAG: hypothetical protein IJU37_06245 [Desulfovibrio sp.]|nr:hypothetical protein [Desulfovibrio sp.]
MGTFENMMNHMLKKWYVVLLCALVGAGLLYVEKAQIAPSVEMTGTQTYARLVRLEPLPTVKLGETTQEIVLMDVIGAKRTFINFIEKMEAQFDMEKLCKGWHNFKQQEKFAWVARHVGVRHTAAGWYEFELEFSSSDAKDAVYVAENHDRMMSALVTAIEETASEITGGAHMVTVSDYDLSRTQEVATQGGIRKKYVVVGFVLGALAGAAVLAVLSLRKRGA